MLRMKDLEDLNEESLTTTMTHVRVKRDDGSTTAAKRSDQSLMCIPFQRNIAQLKNLLIMCTCSKK